MTMGAKPSTNDTARETQIPKRRQIGTSKSAKMKYNCHSSATLQWGGFAESSVLSQRFCSNVACTSKFTGSNGFVLIARSHGDSDVTRRTGIAAISTSDNSH